MNLSITYWIKNLLLFLNLFYQAQQVLQVLKVYKEFKAYKDRSSPNGTQGEPSPVGPGVLNDTRSYLASGPLDGTSPFESNAVCDEGDSATGGGLYNSS